MGLWQDIKALDALMARASVDSGAAASEQPVSTGTASDNAHVEHIDVNSHFVPGVVSIRTVAAEPNPFLLCDCTPGFAGTHKPECGYVRALYERDAR